MKKLIFTVLFLLVCHISKAQYTPFFRDDVRRPQSYGQSYDQNYGGRPQTQTQNLRTTAYQVDYNNNYTKIPIIVTITTHIWPITGDRSQNMKVTSYYHNTFGGQWQNCMDGGLVQKCNSTYGNKMEQSFMYKANIPLIGLVYFDL
ncbi:MAG: hypothetical protein J1E04_00870 [Alistipes sp.]|nr:hypothetical protein [Alistipes sp.]